MATDIRRYSSAVQGLLPTNKYPHLKKLIDQVDFICSNCTSAEGFPVYHTFREAHKEPLGGPGKYTTMYTVYCPVCMTTPTDADFIENGIIDLLKVPAGYMRPPRPNNEAGQDINFEEEDEAILDAAPEKEMPKAKKAKVPTANAKAKKARLKGKKLAAKLAKVA